MASPYLGEIRMFAGNFAPQGFAQCDGQLLLVSQNQPLFSLVGTTYGGDGRTTFGLPDLRGRLPIHMGTGPGLSARALGAGGGSETATVNQNQLPPHSHAMQASSATADDVAPAGKTLANAGADLYIEDSPDVAMATDAVTAVGGGNSHANLMPYQAVNYIIALFGIYPS